MRKDSIDFKGLLYASLMVITMWVGFGLQHLHFFDGCSGAIIPLHPAGLKGILFSPFLHGNVEHIFGNSIPIFVLIFLLYQFYPIIAQKVFLLSWFATLFLVWLLPPIQLFGEAYETVCIIGASGIVYALAFFLFFSGVFRWNMKLLTVSMVVALYYGGLIWGMLPEELFTSVREGPRVSWQSHLAGAIVGIISAFVFRRHGDKEKKYIWQYPHYYNEKDDKLWQEYRENHPDDFLELPQKKKEDYWEHLDEIRKNR